MVLCVESCTQADGRACVGELLIHHMITLWLYTSIQAHGVEQSAHIVLSHRVVGALRVAFFQGCGEGQGAKQRGEVSSNPRSGRLSLRVRGYWRS
jgi:hypothetical protein